MAQHVNPLCVDLNQWVRAQHVNPLCVDLNQWFELNMLILYVLT